MQQPVQIKNALISVFYKDGLGPIVKLLHENGVTIYSTGGTSTYISNLGIPVEQVEDLTKYPSILGGRVKTLHPKIFGGILGRRNHDSDVAQMSEYELPEIDLVIVDLYPFTETVEQTKDHDEIIEKIDIGGVSLIRAAAKNYRDVLIVASRDFYADVLEILSNQSCTTSIEQRKQMAGKAFSLTQHYDTAIAQYFLEGKNDPLEVFGKPRNLRYGENPHQEAAFYGHLQEAFEQISGKELSYNNLVDMESAVYLMEDLSKMAADRPAFAILKHTNACGVAIGDTLLEAWNKALAGDPVSAFGGILITNVLVDEQTATAINELFFEVIIAPGYEHSALEILTSKKNRRVMRQLKFEFPRFQFRSLFDGVLKMDRNLELSSDEGRSIATKKSPSEKELRDLLFAELMVKHLKSNGIALVRDNQLIGIGTGQTSRVDALQQAINKASAFGFNVDGAVMASEAFFPFPDCVEIADKAGIKAVIQPGGSVKDKDSIDYCDANNMSMVITGIRHFKH